VQQTFDESLEFGVTDVSQVERDLEGEQKHVEELVLLVEASDSVTEYVECQVIDDVGDTLRRNRRLGRTGQGQVEKLKELAQRRLWFNTLRLVLKHKTKRQITVAWAAFLKPFYAECIQKGLQFAQSFVLIAFSKRKVLV